MRSLWDDFKANRCHFKLSQNLPDLLRTNQDQEEMTRDHHNCILIFVVHAFNGEQQAIQGIGRFIRLSGFAFTNQDNFWPGLHRNCLRRDRWAIEKDIPSEVFMRTPEFHDNPECRLNHEASVRSLCHEARWFSYQTPNFDGPSLFFLLSMYSVRLILPA